MRIQEFVDHLLGANRRVIAVLAPEGKMLVLDRPTGPPTAGDIEGWLIGDYRIDDTRPGVLA